MEEFDETNVKIMAIKVYEWDSWTKKMKFLYYSMKHNKKE